MGSLGKEISDMRKELIEHFNKQIVTIINTLLKHGERLTRIEAKLKEK